LEPKSATTALLTHHAALKAWQVTPHPAITAIIGMAKIITRQAGIAALKEASGAKLMGHAYHTNNAIFRHAIKFRSHQVGLAMRFV